jgi:hypothetical protein
MSDITSASGLRDSLTSIPNLGFGFSSFSVPVSRSLLGRRPFVLSVLTFAAYLTRIWVIY